jgi:hypothetical protein
MQDFPFRCYLALLTAVPAFTQTPAADAATESKAAAPKAYVYVQTQQGVDVFDAASDGKLTLIKGSPFATSGQIGGVTSSHLISVGTDYLHAYTIESNGAVGKQASEIDTQKYAGSECGTTGENGYSNGAILDHTGKYFYVQLYGAMDTYEGEQYYSCSAWQSYKIASNGDFTFLGDLEGDAGYHGNALPIDILTISGNDKFPYGIFPGGDGPGSFSSFTREANGLLEVNGSFSEVDPTPQPGAGGFFNGYLPINGAADPSGHLAVVVNEPFAGDPPAPQLASYTIKSDGGIVSKNSWDNMPTPALQYCCGSISISTSGKLLAVSGYPGLQIFHFNGAAPITPYSSVLLPAVNIDQLAWDSDNHLFVLSYETGELYVYTVTPTEISEVSGSPYKVENAYGASGLIVVPK